MTRMLWKVAVPVTGWAKTFNSETGTYRFIHEQLPGILGENRAPGTKVRISQSNELDSDGQRIWRAYEELDADTEL